MMTRRHALVLSLTGPVLCYSPVLLFEYGLFDDYRALATADRGGSLAWLSIAQGRPFFALWSEAVSPYLQDVGDFVPLRLVGLAGIGLTAMLITFMWMDQGLKPVTAAAGAMAIVTLPPFQVLAAWATAAPCVWAVVAAALASLLTARASDGRDARNVLVPSALATFLLAVSLLTYQPSGFFFVVAFTLQTLAGDLPRPAFRKRVAFHAGVSCAACLFALGVFIFGLTAVSSGASPARSSFTRSPGAKLEWFASDVLPQAFNLWNLEPTAGIAGFLGVITASGLWLHFRRQSDGGLKLVLSLLLLPTAYLPSLIIAESWPSYRSQLALMPLVLIYVMIAVNAHARWWQREFFPAVTIALATMGIAAAAVGVTLGFALPQSRELKSLRGYMRQHASDAGTLVVRRAHARDSLSPIVRHDEFGTPALATIWGAESLPYIVRREIRPALDSTALRIVLAEPGADFDIDLGAVLRARRTR